MGFLPIGFTYMGFLPIGFTYMGFMLSLSPYRDYGSDSAADTYANQLVAGDEQDPYDVL